MNTQRVNISLPKAYFERLEKEAEKLNLTKTNYIVMALRDLWKQEDAMKVSETAALLQQMIEQGVKNE